jgi:exodeoxyribonuclease-3
MRFVSFNVNSIRVRLHQLQAVIEKHSPEVIGLQETKVQDGEFPLDEINKLGYHVEFHGQKTHYGVALLSKQQPISVTKGFSHDDESSQRRFINCEFKLADNKRLNVMNGYFPQGENSSHPVKYPNKQKFYADLQNLMLKEYKPDDYLLVMGDMNIAPVDTDIGIGDENRKRWLRDGKTCFLPEEREWLQKLVDWGMVDTFRDHYPEVNDLFSWFDYRSKGFDREPKRGLRIDLILASKGINQFCKDAGIDYDIRAMEKPSDHCPIWSDFAL